MLSAMDPDTKANLIVCINRARKIKPWSNNWILFRAILEAAMDLLGEEPDTQLVHEYVNQTMDWYVGDGMYGDGPKFHFDYYNSFVIQPMLLDLVRHFKDRFIDIHDVVTSRAQRYADILERMISPEGTFPIVGRSIVYRLGCFQLLAQMSYLESLGPETAPAQVRCALTAALHRIFDNKNNFDINGWLQPGVNGFQPDLAESYISIGSSYLTSTVFLPLGLPVSAPFWDMPDTKWTSLAVFDGENRQADQALPSK